ncbi:helicase-associated domain-containing protein [Corynebacterium gerontici]|nr:helicase-associated domain-containing protein [Corynebacterium gerontici]
MRRATQKLTALDIAVLHIASQLGAEFSPIVAPDLVQAILPTLQGERPDISVDDARTLAQGAFEHLRAMGMLLDFPQGYVIPAGVLNVIPPGLEPSTYALTPAELTDAVKQLGEKEVAILRTLAEGGGTGTTRDAAPDADPTRPIPRLIQSGMLIRVNAHTVRLPAVLKAVLRGTTPPPQRLLPPERGSNIHSSNASIGSGLEATRMLRVLVEELGTTPGVLVKSGALAQRTNQHLQKVLQCDEATLAMLIGAGIASGVLGTGEPQPLPDNDNGGDYLCPSTDADRWLQLSLADQWADVLEGWMFHDQQAFWKVTAEARKILDPENHRSELPQRRRALLNQALRYAPSDLKAGLSYHHPLLALHMSEVEIDAHIEAGVFFGVLNQDGSATEVLQGLKDGTLRTVCEKLTPAPVTHFIPQGDMTVLAPGPVDASVAQTLQLIADAESQGLASTYRISDSSVRRALDSGLSGAEIQQFLEQHTIGEVPQAITFCIDDAARQHGTIRGGAALSYIRSEDKALLQEALRADTRHSLGLRRIAPTVAVAQVPLAQVLKVLQAAGLMPVAEDEQGLSLDLRPAPARVGVEKPAPRPSEQREANIEAALGAIFAGDAADQVAHHAQRTANPQQALVHLRAAVRAGKKVVLGFVDNTGRVKRQIVMPVDVSGGKLTALAEDELQYFPVHRIAEVGTIDQ